MPSEAIDKSDAASYLGGGKTFQYQSSLPKLPIPSLEDTTKRYLEALKPLQSTAEHEATKKAVDDFLKNDGPALQEKLQTYATDKSSYIEEFWYDAYLQHAESVVLNLNPFFVLEDDPTPYRNNQVVRAASLIFSTLKFINALCTKELEPDMFRGVPLCMSQFSRMFATTRVPTENGCYIDKAENSRHIVVMAHSQCYHFEVLDEYNEILVTEKEVIANLRAILRDATKVPISEAVQSAIGVLTTEKRRNWASLRSKLMSDPVNRQALRVIDSALFIVCLDHVEPSNAVDVATNMLCGTYTLDKGLQVGTCTNRWYDKLQIIVCQNGSAGINFEHTGVDGHTVLRYVSDVYTDTILRFANTISSQTRSIFHSQKKHDIDGRRDSGSSSMSASLDINPRRIEWNLTNDLMLGVRFAETRLSDLILQTDVKVLEFSNYGKSFITTMKMSPDAFVQMAYQAAYYGLYGKIECVYEPTMTKTYLHGRTEAIRSVTEESVAFVEAFYSLTTTPSEKIQALRRALKKHTAITRDCARGQGQDRHMYALDCLQDRLYNGKKKPCIFTDSGWKTLNHTVLSTSNCGNPALRMFGFGPVVSDGFGIGYIIKEDGIAFVASSKHRQTQRFLDTLRAYLISVQRMLEKEKYPNGLSQRERLLAMAEYEAGINGYSYFDNGDGSAAAALNRSPPKVGRRLTLLETDIE